MRMRTLASMAVLALASGIVAAATPAPEQANKKVARRVCDDILSRGRFELAAELYVPDFVNHGRNRDIGLGEDQAAARGWRQAFPDLSFTPEVLVAENDLVAVLWHAGGTNTGAGNGLPATGRRVDGRGMTLWRIVDGRIQEEWSEFGQRALLKQLGLVPGAPPELRTPAPRRAERAPAADVPLAERERNRSVVTRVFEDIVGKGRLELFGTLYAPSFLDHGLFGDGRLEDEIVTTRAFRTLVPDLDVKVVKTLAEGDLVAVLYAAAGTNPGAGLGSPTADMRFRARGMSIMRVQSGRITDEWSVLDQYHEQEELALRPAPPAAGR
jgi:predicted ester cyclase